MKAACFLGALLLAWPAASDPATADATWDPTTARRIDLSLSAFTATPERFGACIGYHPTSPLEWDGCASGDRAFRTVTSHLFYRAQWTPGGFLLGLGPGLGVRAMLYCPFKVCGVSAGPEALVSFEAVKWIRDGLGISLQADAGFALYWTSPTPGLIVHGWRLPARLLAGVTF